MFETTEQRTIEHEPAAPLSNSLWSSIKAPLWVPGSVPNSDRATHFEAWTGRRPRQGHSRARTAPLLCPSELNADERWQQLPKGGSPDTMFGQNLWGLFSHYEQDIDRNEATFLSSCTSIHEVVPEPALNPWPRLRFSRFESWTMTSQDAVIPLQEISFQHSGRQRQKWRITVFVCSLWLSKKILQIQNQLCIHKRRKWKVLLSPEQTQLVFEAFSPTSLVPWCLSSSFFRSKWRDRIDVTEHLHHVYREALQA